MYIRNVTGLFNVAWQKCPIVNVPTLRQQDLQMVCTFLPGGTD